MTRDRITLLAAVSAAVGIGAGAFGAHAAHGIAAELLRTGGMYQLIHAVAALVVLTLDRRIAVMLLLGAAVFAFSLYALALGAPRWTGAVTPVGGATMILAWLWLAVTRR